MLRGGKVQQPVHIAITYCFADHRFLLGNIYAYVMVAMLAKIGQKDTACQHRTYLPRNVCPYSVHQQVIAGIGLLSHTLYGPGGHRKGGNARGANHGVDALIFGQEDVEYFCR